MRAKIFGTKDWTASTVNCCTGCANNCRYCYAKGMAIRFKRLTAEEWPIERVRQKDVDRPQRTVCRPDNVPLFAWHHPGQLRSLHDRAGQTDRRGKPGSDRVEATLWHHPGDLSRIPWGQGQDNVPVHHRRDERWCPEVLGAWRPFLRGKTGFADLCLLLRIQDLGQHRAHVGLRWMSSTWFWPSSPLWPMLSGSARWTTSGKTSWSIRPRWRRRCAGSKTVRPKSESRSSMRCWRTTRRSNGRAVWSTS